MDDRTFAAGRSRRFGTANPTRMDLPFWHHMVRGGEPASALRYVYDPQWAVEEPVWSFYRFGPTRTPLPDGRVVCIGGEHEDSSDPDFCIYNDVTVVHPNGALEIFGYPREVFPPTDFHTATLCGDTIVIVGRLGYSAERGGGDETPVYSLDLESFAITRLLATGPSPGWIHEHEAALSDAGRTLTVWGGRVLRLQGTRVKRPRNHAAAELDLQTLTWRPASPPPPDPADQPPDGWWPDPWAGVPAKDARFLLHQLRTEAPLDHPLFAANVRPLAQQFNRVLVRLLDGTGRFAVVTLTDLDRRATPPDPHTTFHDDLDAALRAGGT